MAEPVVAPADPIEQCRFYLEDAMNVLGGPGNTVVDLGACVGDFLIPALEKGFELGVAVECNKRNIEQLERRLKEIGLRNRVSVFHSIIGCTEDEFTGNRFITIDRLFAHLLETIDLLKIDIEGSEYDAIMRAPSCHWMSRVKVMHLERHNNPPEDKKLLAFLEHAGWVQAGQRVGTWRNTRFE